ncbi:cohesin domain-containing protein [Desulfobacula sp.]|uniref:cohesin domain-containing protein n=1 Tax=Desulfobacula sp. TaxID=2593537 RepID=UPI00260F8148|nr:cohesin domain-containing protein [Desulfobacula sp.]
MRNALKLILTGFLAVLLLYGSSYATTIDFVPVSASIELGGSIDVDIVISGLNTDNLADFSLDVNYDEAILSFTGYSLGTELIDPVWGQDDWSDGDKGGGLINISELSWLMDFSLQPDAFVLATVSFDGMGVGTSALSISNLVLGNDNLEPISAGVNGGSIDVVPEPTTMLLFGIGLLGLAGVSRNKRVL